MNDRFLVGYHKAPRREFADALYRRISRDPSPARYALSLGPVFQRVVWTAVLICVIALGILALSPEVRAQTGAVIRKIGQMIFADTVSRPVASPAATAVPTPAWTYQSQSLSVVEARQAVTFTFQLPTWTPDGYVTADRLKVMTISAPADCDRCRDAWVLSMNWAKPVDAPAPTSDYARNRITLYIRYPLSGVYLPADVQTLEELTVNGRPTALKGLWGAAPADPRDPNLSKELWWMQDQAAYELVGSPGVSVDDLIHMAESIP